MGKEDKYLTNGQLRKNLITKEDVIVQFLAAGKGTRLFDITKGEMPKSLVKVWKEKTIMDLVIDKVLEQGFNRYVFSLNPEKGHFGIDIYKHLLDTGRNLEAIFVNNDMGNANAVNKVIEYTGKKYPILVICSDMLLPWDAFPELLNVHQKGTFTWITSSSKTPVMEKYYGLKVRPDGAVVYDSKLNQKYLLKNEVDLITVTKGGSVLIDPELYLSVFNDILLKKMQNNEDVGKIDFFWDVLPALEIKNQLRLVNNKSSILNAVVGRDLVLDMGTPELLAYVKTYLSNL